MKLWLVCFLLLFFGAEAIQWFGHLPWLGSVELSLPLTVAAGIGLAIASNYSSLFGSILFARPSPSLSSSAAQPEPASSPNPPPPPVKSTAYAKPPKANFRGDTISFEIKKHRRRGEGDGQGGE